MGPAEVHSYLNSFNNFESQLHLLRPEDFYLNRIDHFLQLLGDPARQLKIVHVAGTKGKGSTCAFLASMLQEAGLKVGLYTSPHLHTVNERIRILSPATARSKDPFRGSITDDELAVTLTALRPVAAAIKNEGNILTLFEVLTVAALHYFAKSQVDIVVLETGLGGRLDATNATDSAIAVITPISFDHTRLLGSTLSRIAFEKAGIIKNTHQKVLIAPQEKEVMDVLLARCRELGIQPVLVEPEKYRDLKAGLKGRHQRVNAAVAVEAAGLLKTLGFQISDEALSAGLKNVLWPGRFEILSKLPDVIVDCAHNGASAQALSETMGEEYAHRRVFLVLGVSQDKDVRAIAKPLTGMATQIFLTKADHPRSHSFTPTEAKDYFGDKTFEIVGSVDEAIEKALSLTQEKDVILVAGSVFVVTEAREYFKNKKADNVPV